jgi:hypothetical protein
MQMLF